MQVRVLGGIVLLLSVAVIRHGLTALTSIATYLVDDPDSAVSPLSSTEISEDIAKSGTFQARRKAIVENYKKNQRDPSRRISGRDRIRDRLIHQREHAGGRRRRRIAKEKYHERQRPSDKIIYFLHLHKAGGTTMCKLADENGLSTKNTNCNVQLDQRCCGEDDSLEAQQAYAKDSQYDLVMNERQMYEAMDSENYDYVVMLRESMRRYLSHWKHAMRAAKNFQKLTFTDWWERQPDNWTVRQICGTRCIGIPKFQIKEEQWNYTVERLAQFESILFLEDFETSYQKFSAKHGWDKKYIPPHKSHNTATEPIQGWDSLMTALDDALYEIAQKLESGLAPELSREKNELISSYFTNGPERNCNNDCCAETCSKYR